MKWYILLILGVCCISTSAIFVTCAGVPPTTAAFYRNFFAGIMWLCLYRYSTPFKRCNLRKNTDLVIISIWLQRFIEKGGLVAIFAGLGCMFAVDLWAWHRCIGLVGAGVATLLGNLQVVFIALLSSYAFGEVLKRYYWLGSVVALVGIGLLTLSRGVGPDVLMGLVLGVLTAFTYAIFLIFLKLLARYDITAEQTLFWVAVSTVIFLVGPFLIEQDKILLDARAFGWLFSHAFISSVLGWWLIVKALHYLPVAQAATILLLQPLLTSIWGHFFLGQHLEIIQVVGIIVALAGIRLANYAK